MVLQKEGKKIIFKCYKTQGKLKNKEVLSKVFTVPTSLERVLQKSPIELNV